MAQTAQSLYDEIINYISRYNKIYKNWYCGIASNWEQRLFTEHNVSRSDDRWIAGECLNDNDSRAVEKALLDLGCDGGSGGGDYTTVYVYAYLKSSITNP